MYAVYVHDPNLIEYTKNNLKQRDRVFVNGFVNYKPQTNENGERSYSGHIEATSILKVDRFSEISQKNPIDKRVESSVN